MQTAQTVEAAASAPTTPADTRLLLPVKDAARTLGISLSKTWRLIASDHLETRKIGTRTLVTMASLRHVAEHGAE